MKESRQFLQPLLQFLRSVRPHGYVTHFSPRTRLLAVQMQMRVHHFQHFFGYGKLSDQVQAAVATLPTQTVDIAPHLEALAAGWPFSAATVAIRPDDRPLYEEAIAHLTPAAAGPLGPPATGGETRQQSVLAGLESQAWITGTDAALFAPLHGAARFLTVCDGALSPTIF